MKPRRDFLQIPGPTNVLERILRVMSQPTIEHRSPALSRGPRIVAASASSLALAGSAALATRAQTAPPY